MTRGGTSRWSRVAATAPSRLPAALMLSISPISAADPPRSRTTTTSISDTAFPDRLLPPTSSVLAREERVATDPGDPLADVGEEPARTHPGAGARRVERPPDRHERDGGGEVRHGVDDERQEPAERVQEPADRRPGEPRRRVASHVLRDGGRQVVVVDEVPDRADLGDPEHHRAHALTDREPTIPP